MMDMLTYDSGKTLMHLQVFFLYLRLARRFMGVWTTDSCAFMWLIKRTSRLSAIYIASRAKLPTGSQCACDVFT